MKTLLNFIIYFLLAVAASCQTDTVLVCKGTYSYAYHDHYCQGLKRCRAKVEKVTMAKARSMRRTPCRYCYGNAASTNSREAASPAVQGQFTAITNKGNRCSRKVKSNVRCWQHGG